MRPRVTAAISLSIYLVAVPVDTDVSVLTYVSVLQFRLASGLVSSESLVLCFFFFLMIGRPPRSTLDRSSAASDVYKRQILIYCGIDELKTIGSCKVC